MSTAAINFPVKTAIPVPQEPVEAFCRRWKVRSLSLFGSVLRDDFTPQSDIDVLLDLEDDADRPWDYLFDMHEELRSVFGREVDVIERPWLLRSRNAVRRDSILNSAAAIYVQH